MKRLLTTLVILTGIFAPSLAVAEEVKIDDLVETDGLFYKKFSTEPFTGNSPLTKSDLDAGSLV